MLLARTGQGGAKMEWLNDRREPIVVDEDSRK